MKDDLDEIEDLIEQLKTIKNRKERRRLLAIYNNKQARVWGSFVPSKGYMTSINNNTTLAPYMNNDKYIWNPILNAYVDKIIYEKALETQDPTKPGYTGVSPNFGGGKIM